MLPQGIKRVAVWHGHVDFRKQWNGLLGECRRLGYDPYSGDVLVFIKRDKTQIRAICGDEKGLIMFWRRFEGGCLKFDFTDTTREISLAELSMWFAGAQFNLVKQVKSWR